MQGMHILKVQENNWGKRYIEKATLDQFKFSSSAGTGLGYYKSINKLGISAMVTNGTGYKKAEDDDHKKISFLTVYGEQKLNKKDGLNIGGIYSTENYDFDSLTVKNNSIIGIFAGYAINAFRTGIEWNQRNDNGKDITEKIKSLYANYQSKSNLAIFFKYDIVSLNTKETDENKIYLITGIEYNPGKGLSIAPNYRKSDNGTQFVVNFEFNF